MECKIKTAASFDKEVKWLHKRYAFLLKDLIGLREEVLANPRLGTDLGNGFRKIRMRITSKGRGKSGGARVITFTVIASVDEAEVTLLYIYDKGDRSSVTMQELDELLQKNGLKP